MSAYAVLRRPVWSISSPVIKLSELTASSSNGGVSRRLSQFASWATEWSEQPHIPTASRNYSTSVIDLAHRGLVQPYPTNAHLDQNVFEDATDDSDYDLAASLPKLIERQEYSAASRARQRLVDQQVSITPHQSYETMAMRMLDPANNPYGKVRVNTFLIWWAMTPNYASATPDAGLETEEMKGRLQNVDDIFNILVAEEDIQPLMRFGVLAARKGFSDYVARRIIAHVVRWGLPAVSEKFLHDFCNAALHFSGLAGVESAQFYERRTSWYELTLWGHIHARRHSAAKQLLEKIMTPGPTNVHISSGFCEQWLATISSQGYEHMYKECAALITAAYPAYHCLSWKDSTGRMGTLTEPEQLSSSLPHSLRKIKASISTQHPPHARDLAAFMDAYVRKRPNGPALRLLHSRLSSRHALYRTRTKLPWKAWGTQMGYWATAEMIYHLRHRENPVAALKVFCSYFTNIPTIPLALKQCVLQLIENSSRWSFDDVNDVGMAGQSLVTSGQRLWPSTHTISVFWETVISARAALGLTHQEIYSMFIQGVQRAQLMKGDDATHSTPSMRRLRKLHTRRPTQPYETRFDIYCTVLPPLYKPDAITFNIFMQSFMRSRSSSKKRSEAIFRIFEEMRTYGVTPTATSWSILANAAARSAQWHQLLLLIERMRAGGLIGDNSMNSEGSAPSQATRFRSIQHERVRKGVGSSKDVIYGGMIRGLTEAGHMKGASIVAALMREDGYVSGQNPKLDLILEILDARDEKRRLAGLSDS